MTVEVYNLIKRFGTKTALQIPEFRIETGETVGLVGSNGAGKTTFLRLLLDLLPSDGGFAAIGGENVAVSTDWKAYTGSYLDESFLMDFLTADEFFAFVGSLYGLDLDKSRRAIAPYQSFYQEEEFGHTRKLVRTLSKGNAKKIGLIAAMFISPRLLILDEPFSNLDPPSQIMLKRLIRTLNQEHGTTAIISSHDLMHVTEICSRIAILERGLIARDTPTSYATLKELETYFAS